MGALSGATYDNFYISLKTFARHLTKQIQYGIYDEEEAAYRLSDALLRAARRGAKHPEWFPAVQGHPSGDD